MDFIIILKNYDLEYWLQFQKDKPENKFTFHFKCMRKHC